MTSPAVGHWYINVTLPVTAFMRVQVRSVARGLVWLATDAWQHEQFAMYEKDFVASFRPCEDRTNFVELTCPRPCPCCNHPRFELLSRRIFAQHELQEWKKRERARKKRHRQKSAASLVSALRKAR